MSTVQLSIDGRTVDAAPGSMVIQAAHQAGVYVPHFCYHKKLSIAANCRMCLVDVEKAPKALPACATPVANGMVVHTRSEKAVAAQKSVMEFLLINHPLDCPVCDQGGECQLQDLAVGYGGSTSRYDEPKRVVPSKNLGPLVGAEEMQRCIHCTRCVRFSEEIGGRAEMGMLNRGEHSEITSFLQHAVQSELSGNMIDICPVGALTSKPFRFAARSWELARRRAFSPHDSVGANLVVQLKRDQVLRVVPFENEAVNECWISDRDRFSYTGLQVEDRLTRPMIKGDDGQWHAVGWGDALQTIVRVTTQIRNDFGAQQLGALASPMATTEELALLAQLMRALGSDNIDFRLRQTDDAFDAALSGAPWLGLPIAELNTLDRVLVVGSFLRQDHPLLTQRLRQAAKRGAQVHLIDTAADDPWLPVAQRMTVAPAALPHAVAQVLVALAQIQSQPVPPALAHVVASPEAHAMAHSLAAGERVAVLLGGAAVNLNQASLLAANAAALAQLAGARFGFLTEGGNTVGGYLADAVPRQGGLNARRMLAEPRKAYFVLHAEPLLDADNGAQAVQALKSAGLAVALTAYRSAAEDWADVMLPIAPFSETSGTFVNAEGRTQSFKAVAPPPADVRPAWKVLRVLGNLFELPGFDAQSSENVRDAVLAGDVSARLSNAIRADVGLTDAPIGVQRVADVPIYRADAVVRRAAPLQTVQDMLPLTARMSAALLTQLGVQDGDAVRVRSAQGEIQLSAQQDDTVPADCVRIATGFERTAALGSAFAQLTVERI